MDVHLIYSQASLNGSPVRSCFSTGFFIKNRNGSGQLAFVLISLSGTNIWEAAYQGLSAGKGNSVLRIPLVFYRSQGYIALGKIKLASAGNNWIVTRLRLSMRNAVKGTGMRGDLAGFPLSLLLLFPQQFGFLMLRPQITN